MVKHLVFLVVFIVALQEVSAQKIHILDKSSLQPIENVMVFSQNQQTFFLSPSNGIISLHSFKSNDTIYFRHPSYKIIRYSYKELVELKEIYLQESLVNLSEVVISANKWEQNRDEISNKIAIIKPKDVEIQNPQTAADMLNVSGEIFVQKSQLGGGSPMIRGFSTNTVLLVVDGVRLNNAIYRQGNLQNVINLDPNIMDGSEILFGPGSVIYGSDALGGVMDFHTRKPNFSTSDELLVKGNALFRFSTANSENTGHIDFTVASDELSSVTSFTYSVFDDLNMGNKNNNNDQYLCNTYVTRDYGRDSVHNNVDKNKQIYSGYDQINLLQKFRYRLKDSIELEYAFHFSSTSDIPRYDALRQQKNDAPKFAEWSYGPQEWVMHALTVKTKNDNPLFDESKAIVAYQKYNESRLSRYLNNPDRTEQYEEVKIVSLNYDFNKNLSKKSNLFYGIESIYNGLNSTAQTRNVDDYTLSNDWTIPRYPDGENNYLSAAAYAGYKYRISNKSTLNFGLRYSYIYIHSTFENDYYQNFGFGDSFTNINDAINGSIGYAWRPAPTWQLNANLSSGFHAPNWDGLGKVFAPKKNIIMVPNQDLRPEYAYNAEIGVIKYLLDQAVSIELSTFYTHINSPIVEGDFTINGQDSIVFDNEWHQVRASVNADQAQVYGGNFAINADLPKNFGFKSFLSYTKGYDSNGDKLRHAAPLFGSTHVLYQLKKFKLDVSLIYNGELTNLAPSEADKDYMYAMDENGDLYSPEWYTINAKLLYQISPRIQANFGIENILDVRYRPYSSGIVAPGRNFIFALRGMI